MIPQSIDIKLGKYFYEQKTDLSGGTLETNILEEKPNFPQEKKSSFKKVIENAIRSKRVIKTISFSLEERKSLCEDKQRRRFVSPPPPTFNNDDEEEDHDEDEDDDEKPGQDKLGAVTDLMKPPPLLHSASFFASKSDGLPCPPPPHTRPDPDTSILLTMKITTGLQY